MILDLGCGEPKREGTIGVDIVKMPGVDMVCDLNEKFPFPDNSVDGIYAAHILEHLNDFLFTMREIWRICKPNAWIKIWVPHFSSGHLAWGDPDHKRAFAIGAFEYFAAGDARYRNSRFEVEEVRLNLNLGGGHRRGSQLGKGIEKLVNRSRFAQERFESRWCQLFPFSELYVQLKALKHATS